MAQDGGTAQLDAKLALDDATIPVGDSPASSDSQAKDDYRITLPVFEGPLDLLLHLIRKEQINIYDIPISKICKSYMEHLELMRQVDVNVAGEFMVMAATLTLMKSLVLLPREEGSEEEEDPRLPLVAQLLEYDRFKKAADEIDQKSWLGRDIYPRSTTAIADIMPVESLMDAPLESVDPFQLLLCLKIANDRTVRPPMQISVDPTSIKEKVTQVQELLEQEEVIRFEQLLPAKEDRHVRDVIVAFLALLELAKLKFIEIVQAEELGPMQVRRVKELRELNVGLLDQY
ncbi:MAG: segregation/condensation protein A [Proteobacteria bacterium]|nr:segregation/condensation protein A [Pseudomonadota bacterium]NDC24707.1 segregation/condensation protein A [Pseudomonadota bacterium]NDD04646.1 segregation/condensation protein A [Pseudomonadota bacterium]NDG27068.1 segregation/condensation protein A [Pseudomonadota bacterium]